MTPPDATTRAGTGPAADTWNPDQYARFAAERSQPFFDLLALVQPAPGGRVVDLGCGSGELTVLLHDHVGAAATTGIDASAAMLERARPHARPGLTFEQRDIADLAGDVAHEQAYDVVFANASLQWLPDHEQLVPRVAALVRPGGQLAVQVPANFDHPSHTLSDEVAREEPFASAFASTFASTSTFGGGAPPDPVRGVLRPEQYAEILAGLGATEQHVRLQVYGHWLPTTADVAEWTKGTSLTRFRSTLDDGTFEAFFAEYRRRLVERLGDRAPYFYAFKRILLWARLP